MNDKDSFLRAIAASPEDDLPRLVFADWLEEHGQSAWAEFIRVQCAMAPLVEHANYYARGWPYYPLPGLTPPPSPRQLKTKTLNTAG